MVTLQWPITALNDTVPFCNEGTGRMGLGGTLGSGAGSLDGSGVGLGGGACVVSGGIGIDVGGGAGNGDGAALTIVRVDALDEGAGFAESGSVGWRSARVTRRVVNTTAAAAPITARSTWRSL